MYKSSPITPFSIPAAVAVAAAAAAAAKEEDSPKEDVALNSNRMLRKHPTSSSPKKQRVTIFDAISQHCGKEEEEEEEEDLRRGLPPPLNLSDESVLKNAVQSKEEEAGKAFNQVAVLLTPSNGDANEQIVEQLSLSLPHQHQNPLSSPHHSPIHSPSSSFTIDPSKDISGFASLAESAGHTALNDSNGQRPEERSLFESLDGQMTDGSLEETPTGRSLDPSTPTQLDVDGNLLGVPKPDFRFCQTKKSLRDASHLTCNSEADLMMTCLSNFNSTAGANSTRYLTGYGSFGGNFTGEEGEEEQEEKMDEDLIGHLEDEGGKKAVSAASSSTCFAFSTDEVVDDAVQNRKRRDRKSSEDDFRPRKFSSSQEPSPTSTPATAAGLPASGRRFVMGVLDLIYILQSADRPTILNNLERVIFFHHA